MALKIKKWAKKFCNFFFDFLFEEQCFKCKEKGSILCKKCIYSFPLPHDNPDDKIFSAFSYKDPIIRKMMFHLKYFGKKGLGKKLGAILYERMLEEISEINNISQSKILLTYIPTTKHRLRKRGYNQAQLIALGMAEIDNQNIFIYKPNLLIRKKDTTPQAKIKNKEKRLSNLKNVFSCNTNIKGNTIIVIDDITTTGATLFEAIHVFKKAGAKNAYGFAVAH